MEQIDRLGWAAGLAFVSHGARIGIRVNERAVLERLPALLPPGSVTSASPVVHDLYSLIAGSNGHGSGIRRFSLLYAGSARLARTTDFTEACSVLKQHLHVLVALRAPRRLFLRGGAVGWGDSAIIFPSDDAADVSAVVAALVRAGGTYYSGKYAVLDERGRVHPYTTSFGTDAGGGQSDAAPGEPSNLAHSQRPLPAGLIVFTGSESRTPFDSRLLSPAQAVIALVRYTVVSRLRPAYALKTLERTASSATTLELSGGPAEAALAPLFDRLGVAPTSTRVC
jgi:hypothetical protein